MSNALNSKERGTNGIQKGNLAIHRAHPQLKERLHRFSSRFFNKIHGVSRPVETEISREKVPEEFLHRRS